MKLLYSSDWHYTNKPPKSRKDNYQASIMSKLVQIDELSRKHEVDMVLCGGDICQHPDEDYSVFMDLHDYFSKTYIKHHIVAGQTHDYRAEYSSGLEKSILGALKRTGVIIEVSPTFEFTLGGVKFFTSHQTICPGTFFGHYTSYEDLKTDARVVLISHLHMSFGVQEVNNKIFVSPGSIARNSSDLYNHNRTPQVALIEVSDDVHVGSFFALPVDIEVTLIPLKVELDIFDEKYLIAKEASKNISEMESITKIQEIAQESEIIDLDEVIKNLGKKYSKEAVQEALRLKQNAENE